MHHRDIYYRYCLWPICCSTKPLRKRKTFSTLQCIFATIVICCFLNVLYSPSFAWFPLSSKLESLETNFDVGEFSNDASITIARSGKALEKLKMLLYNAMSANDPPWVWTPTEEYPSVPYQPTSLENRRVPKILYNMTNLPRSVQGEVTRVCRRLEKGDEDGGKIWCQLFTKAYTDTLATTTSILDDNSTYVITGDIDLMWLRDSSAQVHHYLKLWKDPEIQRVIEGLIRRQIQFIHSNPYGSSFRLTLRPNPPSDDSLEPIHVRKGRNVNVAMHNYELDSLCYHIRLSYSWWKESRRTNVFDQRWLNAISIIVQVMIIEQHHSEVSPYRYVELNNDHQGPGVSYTGMTWSAFRPSDDQTKYGYLIPSNMMASVVLRQLAEMINELFPGEIELLKQIVRLREEILYGIDQYGVVNHKEFGKIYAYETDGSSDYLLADDANVPSLLSATYLGFQTRYDPSQKIMQSTRKFILSKHNPLFFQGKYASGIGSDHTQQDFVWPMSIIMEGLTMTPQNDALEDLDYVWQRLELSHVNTFSMHESFFVDDPKTFTRQWFAWASSLLAELILTRLDYLDDWLRHRRASKLN